MEVLKETFRQLAQEGSDAISYDGLFEMVKGSHYHYLWDIHRDMLLLNRCNFFTDNGYELKHANFTILDTNIKYYAFVKIGTEVDEDLFYNLFVDYINNGRMLVRVPEVEERKKRQMREAKKKRPKKRLKNM